MDKLINMAKNEFGYFISNYYSRAKEMLKENTR